MKQLLITAATLMAALSSSFAQINFNMGAGYSDKNVTAQIGLNEEILSIMVGAEIRPSLTRSVDAMQLFGFRAGYDFNGIIPFVAYYYNKFSDSKQQKGQWIPGYGIRLVKEI